MKKKSFTHAHETSVVIPSFHNTLRCHPHYCRTPHRYRFFTQLLHQPLHICKIYKILHIKTFKKLRHVLVLRPSSGSCIFPCSSHTRNCHI